MKMDVVADLCVCLALTGLVFLYVCIFTCRLLGYQIEYHTGPLVELMFVMMVEIYFH